MKLNTDYTYITTDDGKMFLTEVTQVSTGKKHVFKQSNSMSSVEKLTSHMDSLTDDLLSGWFKEPRQKPAKPAKVLVPTCRLIKAPSGETV